MKPQRIDLSIRIDVGERRPITNAEQTKLHDALARAIDMLVADALGAEAHVVKSTFGVSNRPAA